MMQSRQKKAVWFASLLAVFAAVGSTALEAVQTPGPLLRFDGFTKLGDEVLFALSLRSSALTDVAVARGWLRLGQSFADQTLISYDSGTERISLQDSNGNVRVLAMAAAAQNGVTPLPEEKEFKRAIGEIEQFLDGLRKRWRSPATFKIDSEGAAMPEAERNRFLRLREREESSGGYLIGVEVGGTWIFSRFNGSNHRLLKGLSGNSRRQVEAALALAMAEAAAHVLAEKQRTQPFLVP